jgi:hypothetical protein
MSGRGRFLRFAFAGRFLFVVSQAPAAGLAVQAAILFFPGDGGSALHTKDLVHWLAGGHVVAREPALTIIWTGVLMFSPVRIFGWMDFNRVEQKDILPDQDARVASELSGSITHQRGFVPKNSWKNYAIA